MDYFPHPRCILDHWCFSEKLAGKDWADRHFNLTSLRGRQERHGLPALQEDFVSGIRGERSFSSAFLLLGTALFHATELGPLVGERILYYLQNGSIVFQLAATYAAAFVLDREEEVSLILTERLLNSALARPLLVSTRDALNIRADTRHGGQCRRCRLPGRRVSDPLPDWLPDITLRKTE